MTITKTGLLAALCSIAFGSTSTIVVPNANATVAGNDNSGFPLGTFSIEQQTVIDPDQFPAGQIYITGFAFRAAPGLGAINFTSSGSIYFSTSPNWANSTGHPLISTTLANNVGPDNTLVFSGNNVTITAPGCAAPGPCAFGNGIGLTTPFPYNPVKGPLLIDLKFTSLDVISGQIESQDCNLASCPVNGVFAAPLGTPTAAKVNSSGAVLKLHIRPCPAGPRPTSP